MAPVSFLDTLHQELLGHALAHFFPESVIEHAPRDADPVPELTVHPEGERTVAVEWLAVRYRMHRSEFDFTEHDHRMLRAIGRYVTARHRLAHHTPDDPGVLRLFGGRPEDHVVSAWLDLAASGDTPTRTNAERIDDAVEVLRTCALGTYENRRITMGVLLFGALPDACHERPPRYADAIRYARPLTSIRSFRRLSDGLQTVALVDESGMLVEIVEVNDWAQPFAGQPLAVPAASAYAMHARATLCGGHLCLVLTSNGEIKAFADGVQAFNFLDGVWRLTNAAEKQRVWRHALGRPELADRLFSVALDLAEDRRGGLFLVVDDPAQIDRLVAAPDLLGTPTIVGGARAPALKRDLHYLLRGKSVLDLAPSVLETLGRIDGAVVIDSDAHLLAFGAIVRHPLGADALEVTEGGRSTAAVTASHAGKVLKISEDGLVSFYDGGRCVWEL
jgi:hypothetical protein